MAVEGQAPEEGHRHQIQDGDLLVSVLPSECLTLLLNYRHRSRTPGFRNYKLVLHLKIV